MNQTDIGALIERVKRRIAALERPVNYAAFFGDSDGAMEAEDGYHAGLQEAADLRALISLASPSPAQWPEDVVERATQAYLDALDYEPGHRPNVTAAVRAALATLPPPEDERVVKGLVDALEGLARRASSDEVRSVAESLLREYVAPLVVGLKLMDHPDERT